MRPRNHVIFGFLFSLVVYLFFGLSFFEFSLLFLSSVFIDLDHATRYSIRTGNFSPLRFLRYSDNEGARMLRFSRSEWSSVKYPLFVFHGFDVVLLLFVLSFWFPLLFFVSLGFLFHLCLDYIQIGREGIPFGIKVSPLYVFFRNLGKHELKVAL